MGQLRNTMDVNMPETAKMSVTASSAETRNKIGELTKSIGNISFSSSGEDSISKKEIPGNLTETNKVRRNTNKNKVYLPMPRKTNSKASRSIIRKQDYCKKCDIYGHKKAECNGYSHELDMQKLKKESRSNRIVMISEEMKQVLDSQKNN